jgi:small-conductance mechanosensitive channel
LSDPAASPLSLAPSLAPSFAWLDDWWQPAAAAAVAVLVALLVYRISRPLALRLVRGTITTRLVVQRLDSALHWLFPVIALQAVWGAAPDALVGIEGVRHANVVLLIIAVAATAIAAVRGLSNAVVQVHPQDVADNLEARRILTQSRVLSRIAIALIVFGALACILVTFPRARQIGTSLIASAGVSALVIGIAARTVVGNLLAGLQIALTQPIRIDDVLIIETEWVRVEEITGTYVVLKIWDERRLVIPLQWFIEHPFQNWTRSSSQIIGSVFFWVDYTTDLAPLRAEATRLAEASKDYDGRVCLLQVVDTSQTAMQLRLIVSSPSAGQSWDLRCELREGVIAFMQRTQPQALPRMRAEVEGLSPKSAVRGAAPTFAPEADRDAAVVNNETGMSELAGPTGGIPPPLEPPK